MNQWEFDTIGAIIYDGAPALAERLTSSLKGLVDERNKLVKDNESLRLENESLKKETCECEKDPSEKTCECSKKLVSEHQKKSSKQS